MTFWNSEGNVYVTYSCNDILCSMILIRTIPMFLMVFSGIKYNSNRSDRIW